ncbi:MAG: hypothetical protein ACFB2Z_08315 [Maricaulaceae bacterium]
MAHIEILSGKLQTRPLAGVWRRLIWAGGLVAVVFATLAVTEPQAKFLADPDLARLLVGMAAIKSLLVSPVLAFVGLRIGQEDAAALRLVYGALSVMTVLGITLIASLSAIALGSVLFHASWIGVLFVSNVDDHAVHAVLDVAKR